MKNGFGSNTTRCAQLFRLDERDMNEERPWRKLLWVKQPYPDNYVDVSFLSQLRRNSSVQLYTFRALFNDATVLLMHLCNMAAFALVFIGIYSHNWDPKVFASIGGCLVVVIASFLALTSPKPFSKTDIAATTKSGILILCTVLTLSPVLKSLTLSTSSDSIWSLATWLCMINVCTHDYAYDRHRHARVRSMLSTNFALFAATVLASRLSTAENVFYFLVFSMCIFGVVPEFTSSLRDYSYPAYQVYLLLASVVTSIGLYLVVGWWSVLVWTVVQLSVIVMLPLWLMGLQKYKNEIQGPWDPAKPILRRRAFSQS